MTQAACSRFIGLWMMAAVLLPKSVEAQGRCERVETGFGPRGTTAIAVETVVTGLEVPWSIAFLPEGSLLVSERPGRVRLVRDERLREEPVFTVDVPPSPEGGLLGIALHPRYPAEPFLYVYTTQSTEGGTMNRVDRWRLSRDATEATFDRRILDGIPAARFHDGGRIRFGPDGMLYIATGDAGRPDRAQDLGSLAGKLLRIRPDGRLPADNPFAGSPIYLLGLRNPEGFDFHPEGFLVVADHGPSGELNRRGHDEINVVPPGANLGWPTIYGCGSRAGLTSPTLVFVNAVPPGGAALYTSDAIPGWTGSLLVGTLGSKHLHRVVFDPAEPRRVLRHEVYFQGDPPQGLGRLRETIMGPDGELYLTTSNCDGRGRCPPEKDRIVRVVPVGG